ncbi:MAG: hypothetical protein HY505_02540 [Candidatus Yanofskybacteria bacterium]|nr:hypothetical protein [Candidatus Yanofskybacteria bacterium]
MDLRELTVLGASLYACEGTKARRDFRRPNGYNYSIELTNSDPNIVRVFSLFLKKIIKADWKRVKGQLFLYPDLDENELKMTWSKASGIPTAQFQKSICLKKKISKFKPNPLGTFKLRYPCKEDFLKLQSIIDNMWSEFN